MREKNYPSDVSRERFEQIRPILEQARKRTKPVTVDMYEVWCAVLYLLRTGCPWRALPSDFPKWRTVHSYFAKWSEVDDEGISLLERALKKSQVGAAREKQGRKACSTFLIVDAQSVKNSDTAGQKGYDAGKKVSGIKRHIAVDTQGFPHAVAVTTAEVQGAGGIVFQPSGLGRVKRLLCDSGYTGDPFAEGVQDILGKHVTVQIAKRSELHTFKVMPKRWSVERSFAWLEKNRRLWKNCERRLNTSLQFIHLAFLALLLRRS
ncbi:IS5 family transposase [Xanthomonas oryzae pv. oryzae]|uniref:IS5 family transposase n=1 Tax=Xanthomonas oryzae TaxID=347 RepID=UPI000E293E57|nr:IS5 family transposase [Xanthomonas oryzae]AXM12589.1 IS5 family transposase [Xanthomonas oryzae pv. oryzae]